MTPAQVRHRRGPLLPRLRRAAHAHLTARLATVGLVLVLLVLTAFTVTGTVANARAADEAQRSALVSSWSEQAEESLLAQEDLADELVAEPDGETRAEYEAAGEATRTALRELGAVPETDHARFVAGWLALHDRYERSVEALLATAAADPAAAEAFEEASVDPHYDAIEAVVQAEADRHWAAARTSLADMGRTQHVLLVATPAVFGVGLLMLGTFLAALTRSRRETAAKAEENRHQALHDALTGLPNRTLLQQRTGEALRAAADGGAPVALLLVDLDRFKEINDTLGHHYGDVVLVAVAERLHQVVGREGTVARLSGDEFAVLLPARAEAALRIAEEVHAALVAPVEVDGAFLGVEASIGVVDGDPGLDDVGTLFRHADIAMYAAKGRGLGVCRYAPDLDGHSAERLRLLGELRRAVDEGELVLHYQPKVSLPGERVEGAEALVRWQHPRHGLLFPDAFIPLAERTALIRPLTRWVVDAALRQCRSWLDSGRVLRVAVNVSARNLSDDRLADDVAELLQRWGVPASCLELEMTESAILADPARARAVLERLAALGVVLSVDDFGAGYTSLGHLKNLPVHVLKVDRSFVAAMGTDRSDALIVRSIVELGHNLGLRTVAEGVEDRDTAERLAALGCDEGQGYLWSRPLPAAQFERWVDAARPVPTGS
ncbi:bifunctional diguanylate cyclase/phosphodiesterase [Kineococcus glutinatus]|uniref:Diguanylate cyclase (GGDEF)-like protein n=1 Tax=Kineococcus glutinatus TaxID=1070872 RepID=A0ABP9I127_9ACTN